MGLFKKLFEKEEGNKAAVKKAKKEKSNCHGCCG